MAQGDDGLLEPGRYRKAKGRDKVRVLLLQIQKARTAKAKKEMTPMIISACRDVPE